MAVNITVTQALKVIGEVLQVVETYKQSPKKVTDDITLVESVINVLTTNNIGIGDIADILSAVKPYLGFLAALTSK
jgi:hypothetical protein